MTEGTRVGTVIEEKYRLDEQIGRGTMGAVYRGTQLMVDRSVAIKLLHPTFAGHDKIQARFEVEAKAIARLNHPNCITLFDFGYSDDLEAFYTVVEYIDGISLEKILDQKPSVQRIVDLVKQIASALGHAHHHGILHRDLKPENIMLAQMTDGSDIIKVLDFGIAQIMKGNADEDDDEFEEERLTRVGEVFGTPPYMSPEQAQSSRDLSPAADLYSLGVIFYELLEGRLPFFADAPVEIMRMHMTEPPPPMKRAGLPESLRSIVMQMLAKEPDARPESGEEIVELLESIPDEELTSRGPVASAAGTVRDSEPTLVEAPDDESIHGSGEADTIQEFDGEETAPGKQVDGEQTAPDEASEIYELTDLVAGAEALPKAEEKPQGEENEPTDSGADDGASSERIKVEPPPQAAVPPPSSKLSPPKTSQDRERIKATQFLRDGVDSTTDYLDQISWHHKKLIIGVVVGLLLSVGVIIWLFAYFEPFGFASEDGVREVGEVAARHHQSSESTSEEEADDTVADEIEEPADMEFVATDPSHENVEGYEEDDEEDSDEEDAETEEEEEVSAESIPPRRTTPRRTTPSSTSSQSDQEEQTHRERPVRLGGTRELRGVRGDSSDDESTD